MKNQEIPEPGFTGVMQNMVLTPRTPFASNPDLAKPVVEDNAGKELNLVFSANTTEHMTEISKSLGFENLVDFITTATSIYGQMLGAAKDEGYSKVLMMNPVTEEVIQVSLVSSELSTN